MLVRTLFKSPVVRDKTYLQWIREQGCIICRTRENVHAHHEGGRGMAIKASDRDAIPLCFSHHRERHDNGKVTFWRGYDVAEIISRLNAAYDTRSGK
jgi:hypothetical protein